MHRQEAFWKVSFIPEECSLLNRSGFLQMRANACATHPGSGEEEGAGDEEEEEEATEEEEPQKPLKKRPGSSW